MTWYLFEVGTITDGRVEYMTLNPFEQTARQIDFIQTHFPDAQPYPTGSYSVLDNNSGMLTNSIAGVVGLMRVYLSFSNQIERTDIRIHTIHPWTGVTLETQSLRDFAVDLFLIDNEQIRDGLGFSLPTDWANSRDVELIHHPDLGYRENEDFDGLRVAVLRDSLLASEYARLSREAGVAPEIVEVGTWEQAFRLFLNGNVQAVVVPNSATATGNAVFDTTTPRGRDGAGTAAAEWLRGTAFGDIFQSRGSDTIYGEGGADLLWGVDGNHRFFGGAGADTLRAQDGNNTLSGGLGHDELLAGGGRDLLLGGAGDDDIDAADGADTVWGGAGHDTIDAGSGNDRVGGFHGDDVIMGRTGNDTLFGGTGDDDLRGGHDHDAVWGYTGNNYLDGGAGDDRLGGLGHDTIIAGFGNDTVYGAQGNDSIHAAGFENIVFGGTGRDSITAGGTVFGGDGNDLIQGLASDDALLGESDNDTILGGSGNDVIQGNGGNDSLNGEFGDDFISGSFGHDTIYDREGANTISGGSGNDLITNSVSTLSRSIGGAGDDTISGSGLILGGSGDDVIDADTFGNGGRGHDVLTGGAYTTALIGEGGNDTITIEATFGSPTLNGGAGRDSIVGGGGSDSIIAGSGYDTVQSSFGNDTISLGSGRDMFIFSPGVNVLTDFDVTEDVVDLRHVLSITDFADLINNHTDTIPLGLRISGGPGSGALVFPHLTIGSLSADDFLFN